ncbi:MAG: hypothetical protein WA971_03965, partial [Microbacterium sp.]
PSGRPVVDGGEGSRAHDGGGKQPRGRRLLFGVVAAVCVLLIGFGIGWFAFAREAAPGMNAEQREAWAAIEALGKFDSGSVKLLGGRYGVSVWHTLRADGKYECLLLTVDGQPVAVGDFVIQDQQGGCQPVDREDADMFGNALYGHISLPDEEATLVQASVQKDIRGVEVVLIGKYTPGSYDWRSQYTEDELAMADVLVDQGFEGQSLQIIGYDGDLPIWLTQSPGTCAFLVDMNEGLNGGGVTRRFCGTPAVGQPLQITGPDGTRYDIEFGRRGPQLTIVRGVPFSLTCVNSETGDAVECQTRDE